MNQKMRILFFILLVLSFSACGKDKDYLVTISTRHGEIKAILFDDTPVHKEN
ncbi:MAG: peptidylprolyl isomerase, partial [Bacteroidetes bacterium]|nr:peptidylprolyl isomerase [Bacteroidota bacterium]